MKRMFGLMMVVFAAVGCYKHSFTAGTGGNTAADPRYSAWHAHWLFGIIGEDDVDVKKVCPSGNATIKEEETFVNGLVGALVGIVYAPTTVEVYCAEGAPAHAASITLSPEKMLHIALNPATLDAVSSENRERLANALTRHRDRDVAATVAGTTLN